MRRTSKRMNWMRLLITGIGVWAVVTTKDEDREEIEAVERIVRYYLSHEGMLRRSTKPAIIEKRKKLILQAEKELKEVAIKLSRRYWGMDYDLPICIEEVEGRAGGFYHNSHSGVPTPVKIGLTRKYMNRFDEEVLVDTLKHELCHWACFVKGMDFKDGDEDFENELKRIGARSCGKKKLKQT